MRKIELEVDEGVSEWRNGQRLDDSRLISCIRTCFISIKEIRAAGEAGAELAASEKEKKEL